MYNFKGLFIKFKNNLKKKDKKTIIISILAVAVIAGVVCYFAYFNKGFSMSAIFGMSKDEIGRKTIDYINNNQLSQTPASLISVSEESGVVKVKIKIGENEFDSYVSKDGKLLFPEAFDMTPVKEETSSENSESKKTASSLEKTSAPLLETFIVSNCPYGLQMQRAFADAVKNISALSSSVKVRYIGAISDGTVTSMHGNEEAQENLNQICIREEQPAKYWSYVSCYMKKKTGTASGGMPMGDSKGCLTSTGVDTAKLNSCISDKSRGLAYAQKDFDLSNQYGVTGSPTTFLNGFQLSESDYGGRSSDAIKSMVCAGFTEQPGFCSTKLNTASASVSFNAEYASSGSSSDSANCN